MIFAFAFTPAERRLLPEGRAAGPMPWVIAIMIFLTVLAAAAGLALSSAAQGLGDQLAGRVTIQVVEADRLDRDAQAAAAARAARALPGVARVAPVSEAEMSRLLAPWLGEAGLELPAPALIDVDLADPAALDRLKAAVARVAPAARIDAHARWLAPLRDLIGTLRWLAAVLVLLMGIATAACVVLAARAALNTHRETIDVLHLLGATDVQIARLFQRRIALDALFGGGLGFAAGALVLALLAARIGALGSELVGSVRLDPASWLALLAVPLAGALLATAAARLTVERALRRIL
ncbi:MAG TPA: FtsX-like permease family protein [Sphingomonas sp.]|nr:FtsX-like permease family protein [Sphingomonas sp.]